MSGKLFAFRVAKPVEPSTEETFSVLYDPQTQTAVWQGGTRPLAVNCCLVQYGHQHCNAYGTYCNEYGLFGHYGCD
jgi:hypothetical protein